MLGFFLGTARLMVDPVIFAGGIMAGYFFHADMKKLAWGLLLFILPAVPPVWSVHLDGMFLSGLAQMLAASTVAAAAYWGLETLKTRARSAGLDS